MILPSSCFSFWIYLPACPTSVTSRVSSAAFIDLPVAALVPSVPSYASVVFTRPFTVPVASGIVTFLSVMVSSPSVVATFEIAPPFFATLLIASARSFGAVPVAVPSDFAAFSVTAETRPVFDVIALLVTALVDESESASSTFTRPYASFVAAGMLTSLLVIVSSVPLARILSILPAFFATSLIAATIFDGAGVSLYHLHQHQGLQAYQQDPLLRVL